MTTKTNNFVFKRSQRLAFNTPDAEIYSRGASSVPFSLCINVLKKLFISFHSIQIAPKGCFVENSYSLALAYYSQPNNINAMRIS